MYYVLYYFYLFIIYLNNFKMLNLAMLLLTIGRHRFDKKSYELQIINNIGIIILNNDSILFKFYGTFSKVRLE